MHVAGKKKLKICMNKTSEPQNLVLRCMYSVQGHISGAFFFGPFFFFPIEKAEEAQVEGSSLVYGLLIFPRQLTDHSFV